MLAIFSPGMPRAAPIRQDSGRPHVHSHPAGTEGLAPIMTQTYADVLTAEERSALDAIIQGWYRDALHVMQGTRQPAPGLLSVLVSDLVSPDAYRSIPSPR